MQASWCSAPSNLIAVGQHPSFFMLTTGINLSTCGSVANRFAATQLSVEYCGGQANSLCTLTEFRQYFVLQVARAHQWPAGT